jgi:transcriptional regulator with XRE-family HTH domain
MQLKGHFRAIREKIGLTQADACEILGISEGFLSKIEAGKALPKIRLLLRFGRVYNCHPLDLFTFYHFPLPRLLREWRCAVCGAARGGAETEGSHAGADPTP